MPFYRSRRPNAFKNQRGTGKKPTDPNAPPAEVYARLPRASEGEVIGMVTQLLGGARMRVTCQDGRERLCRVPGNIKRRIWVREGDYVIIQPWSVEGDEKADIVYRYTGVQYQALKNRGLIKDVSQFNQTPTSPAGSSTGPTSGAPAQQRAPASSYSTRPPGQ